jgi:predicted glycosyl hydrolase (DUF1957 family)
VKIKLLDILNSKEVLGEMGKKKDFDGLTSYKVARNIRNINIELENFEKVKTELIRKYGEKKENGSIEVLESNKDEYLKQLSEILQEEINIDVMQISPEKLFGVSPFELMSLDWMIEIEKEAK